VTTYSDGVVAADLGRLPGLAAWAARVQRQDPPEAFRRIRAVLVDSPGPAGAADPTDASPEELTLGLLAERAGVSRRIVDVVTGAGAQEAAGAAARRGPVLVEELTDEEFEAAYELGRYVADEEVDSGADLLLVGAGSATAEQDLVAATALVAALLGREPLPLIGTDTARGNALGLDDRSWARRVAGVRDVLRRTRVSTPMGPVALLRTVGGPRVAVLTGLLQQAAERRTPALLDGTVTCAAALAADQLAPESRRWWLAAASPAEPAGRAALADLDLSPLLDLDIRAGSGAAALLAVPILAAAVDLAGAAVQDDDAGDRPA
jgi:nicotinate-nucleotide--dimethylbenzimidazole phosphoribosyltransferase